jgi:hypothetical protein
VRRALRARRETASKTSLERCAESQPELWGAVPPAGRVWQTLIWVKALRAGEAAARRAAPAVAQERRKRRGGAELARERVGRRAGACCQASQWFTRARQRGSRAARCAGYWPGEAGEAQRR